MIESFHAADCPYTTLGVEFKDILAGHRVCTAANLLGIVCRLRATSSPSRVVCLTNVCFLVEFFVKLMVVTLRSNIQVDGTKTKALDVSSTRSQSHTYIFSVS